MNNVLIIEDDKEICVMIKDHLEKYNVCNAVFQEKVALIML